MWVRGRVRVRGRMMIWVRGRVRVRVSRIIWVVGDDVEDSTTASSPYPTLP